MNANTWFLFKQLSTLLTLTLITFQTIAGTESCEAPKKLSDLIQPFPDYLQPYRDKLDSSTANWAMEYSGADLANSSIPEGLKKASVAVLDVGFQGYLDPVNKDALYYRTPSRGLDPDDHGSIVTNIISDSSGLSSGRQAQLRYMLDEPNYDEIVSLFAENGYPQLLNNSQLNYTDSDFQPTLSNLLKNNVIYIGSGGNGFPSSFSKREVFEKIFVVGWLDNDGLYHADSTDGEHIDLVAPAGISMLVKKSENEYTIFGGSSGAAPHFTGVLANLTSIIGTNDFETLEILVKKSSLPYPIRNNRNGAGALNAFKAVQVALRLREACGTDLECLKREAADDKHYSFNPAASNGQVVLDKCRRNPEFIKHENQCTLNATIQQLRRNFFLTRDLPSARALSCVYEKLGFDSNARYYGMYAGNEDPAEYIKKQGDEVFLRNAPYFSKYPEEEFNSRIGRLLPPLQQGEIAPFDRVMMLGKILENALRTTNPMIYLPDITEVAKRIEYDFPGYGFLNIYHLINVPSAPLTDGVLLWVSQNKKLADSLIEKIICYEKSRNLPQAIFSEALRLGGNDLKPYQNHDTATCERILEN